MIVPAVIIPEPAFILLFCVVIAVDVIPAPVTVNADVDNIGIVKLL